MEVIDNERRGRYELRLDHKVVALASYELHGDLLALTHTQVAEGHEGEGLARTLIEAVLDDARQRGLGVLPRCPYVRALIAGRPDEYLDLVPEDRRAAFGLDG